MKTKKEVRFFSIFAYEKEQEYLRRQHKAGWKFVKVTGLGMYHFEECEAEDVIYQLDYNQEASSNKEEYQKMFADCGWEYLQEYMGYSYFRKAAALMDGEEEIFSDDSSRLAMLERVIKGRMLPMLVIFFACLLPQFMNHLNEGRYFTAGLLGATLLLYVCVFAYCAIVYYKKIRK